MRNKRPLNLLESFSHSEERDFEIVMNSTSRESLQNIYREIKNDKSLLDNKPEMFRKVFGKKYRKDKDYLLRNELRLLTDKIREFLISRQSEVENRENPSYRDFLLQKSLFNRGLFREYETAFKKGHQRAMEHLNFDMAQKMLNQYFNYLMTQPKITPEMIELAHETLTENLENIKYRYRTDVAINQQGRAAMEAFLKAYGKEKASTEISTDLDLENHSNSYIRFFEFSALALQSAGEEKIKYAKKAADNIKEVEAVFPKSRIDGLAMLAGAYFVLGKYEDASKIYKEALEFAKSHKQNIRNDILFNYVSALMKLGNYERASKVMEANQKNILSNPKVKHKFIYFHCMAHVFQGNHKKARKIIPQNISKLPEDEQHYFRFIYCILPYLNDDLETAIREGKNFIAYFNHHAGKLAFPHEKRLAHLFRSFFSILEEIPKRSEKRDLLLQEKLKELEDYLQDFPQYRDYLYVKWLRGEISNHRSLSR